MSLPSWRYCFKIGCNQENQYPQSWFCKKCKEQDDKQWGAQLRMDQKQREFARRYGQGQKNFGGIK